MRSGSRALASTSERMLSVANLVEVGIVMQARRGDDGACDVDLLLAKLRSRDCSLHREAGRDRAQGVSALWPRWVEIHPIAELQGPSFISRTVARRRSSRVARDPGP